jgi:hypothetical protein
MRSVFLSRKIPDKTEILQSSKDEDSRRQERNYLYFTEGPIDGGLKLADRASGRTKRVVMMMQRDDQNCQEKAHKRNKNNFLTMDEALFDGALSSL